MSFVMIHQNVKYYSNSFVHSLLYVYVIRYLSASNIENSRYNSWSRSKITFEHAHIEATVNIV